MKNSMLCFVFTFCAFALHAQIYVEGKELSPPQLGKYLSIYERGGLGHNDYSIVVDYGQKRPAFSHFDELTDADGKVLRFASIVAVLNYFEALGWEFEAYLLFGGETRGGEYLLKRK